VSVSSFDETEVTPSGESQEAYAGEDSPEDGAGAASEEEGYPDSGLKMFRFKRSKLDFGKVSVVASIITSRGEAVRDGDPIELSQEEVDDLKKGGHTFEEVSDEGGDG
jgi:hypothetical protein